MRFDWNPEKDRTNQRKHRVSFQEACTIFADRSMLSIYDGKHSIGEDRWVTIGISERGRILVVVHTWRDKMDDEDELVRIISARLADRAERGQYLERRR
jgi:uncharacterized DUF497 family protein